MTNLKKEFLALLKNKSDLRWDDLREAKNSVIEKGLLKPKEGKKAGYFFAFIELIEDLKKMASLSISQNIQIDTN